MAPFSWSSHPPAAGHHLQVPGWRRHERAASLLRCKCEGQLCVLRRPEGGSTPLSPSRSRLQVDRRLQCGRARQPAGAGRALGVASTTCCWGAASNSSPPLDPVHSPQTSEEFYTCAWSLDTDSGAPLLLLAGKNGQLLVVAAGTGVLETCLDGHGSAINDIAVHPGSPQFVATASRDHSVRLWNIHTRCVCRRMPCAEQVMEGGGQQTARLSVTNQGACMTRGWRVGC